MIRSGVWPAERTETASFAPNEVNDRRCLTAGTDRSVPCLFEVAGIASGHRGRTKKETCFKEIVKEEINRYSTKKKEEELEDGFSLISFPAKFNQRERCL